MTLIHFRTSIQIILVALLTSMVLAVPVTEPAQLPDGVLGKLSSEQYEVREKAYGELYRWAVKNIKDSPETLHSTWRASEDPEAKTRCYTLMKEMVLQRNFGRGKGFVGIRMDEFVVPGKQGAPGRAGVRVSLVLADTPAAKAGLKVGDVIVGVDEIDFSKVPQVRDARLGVAIGMGSVLKFSDYIQAKQPDDVINLHLMRAGKMVDMKITLMKRPASADVDPFGGTRRNDTKVEADRFFKKWLKEKGE